MMVIRAFTAGGGRGVVFWWGPRSSGNEFGEPASVESDVPSLAVHDNVMAFAEKAHVFYLGVTTVDPVHEVMGLTIAGWAVAPGKRTFFIALSEGVADGGGGQAVLASDVEGHGVAVEHHGDQGGVAGQASGFGGGQVPAGVQGRGLEAVDEVAQCHGEY